MRLGAFCQHPRKTPLIFRITHLHPQRRHDPHLLLPPLGSSSRSPQAGKTYRSSTVLAASYSASSASTVSSSVPNIISWKASACNGSHPSAPTLYPPPLARQKIVRLPLLHPRAARADPSKRYRRRTDFDFDGMGPVFGCGCDVGAIVWAVVRGWQLRLQIARALAWEGRILILDECTLASERPLTILLCVGKCEEGVEIVEKNEKNSYLTIT